MGCIEAYGSEKDTYADNLFVAQFTALRLFRKLCLLTQDYALASEILELNTSSSSGKNKSGKNQIKGIKAYKFFKGGLVEFGSFEKNHIQFPSNNSYNSSFFSY